MIAAMAKWFAISFLFCASIVFADSESIEATCVCGNGIQEAFPENSANPSCPFKLYGSTSLDPNTQSRLYVINSYDGSTIEIGPIKLSNNSAVRRVSSLDFSPEGVLYAIGVVGTGASAQSRLLTIDCTTAIATSIGNIGIAQSNGTAFTDINFNQYGQLFAYLKKGQPNSLQNDELYTINVATAAPTLIGKTFPLQREIGNAIAFTAFPTYPVQPLHYAGNFNLSTLDYEAGGQSSIVSSLGFADPANNRPRTNALDTDFLTNVVYSSINDKASGPNSLPENYLGTLNLSTGEFTFIKLPAVQTQDGLDGIAVNRPYEECDTSSPIPSGCSCGQNCYLVESDCGDGSDNDFDGLSDCSDSDCDGQVCSSDGGCTPGTCNAGSCQMGAPLDCNDDNPCTDDSCAEGGCINASNTGNFCTDFNPCTSDNCDISGECLSEYLPNGTSCDDESPCTIDDSCQDGQCIGNIVPEICNNGVDDDCDTLVDGADPDCAGSSTIEVECDDGIDNDGDLATDCEDADCNNMTCETDNNSCTDDVCIFGFCDHSTDDTNSCTDNNPCTNDVCFIGDCVSTNNTNACNDNNPCTQNDVCSLGICQGSPIICNDANACTNDVCIGGSCSFIALNGDPCASDGNQCTDDICSAGICSHVNDNANSCNDGQLCTSGDHCVSGLCVGTPGVETTAASTCNNAIDDDCDGDIDDLDPDCQLFTLKVFVTKNTYLGNIGGATQADALCQASAVAASRSGTFKAFLSTSSSNAASRITNPSNKAWYMYSGSPNRVADDKTDLLDGTIQQAINIDEYGNEVGHPKLVWTGSNANGTVSTDTCNNWTTINNNIKGIWGATDKTDYKWANQPNATCNKSYRLYCFEVE